MAAGGTGTAQRAALADASNGALMAPAVHAAGAVVWRVVGRALEVLLIHRPKYDDWSWPKGKIVAGETLPACAVREIAEETGVVVALGQPLPAVRYRLPDGRAKICHYWSARALDHSSPAAAARGGVPPCDEAEVDEARWVSASQARRMLTSPSDRAPLDALVDLFEDGHLATHALVVLRHARAKKRSAWPGGEETRPLTAVGLRQASHLPETLSAFGAEQVFTSPWERCAATVAPYAQAAGVAAVTVPTLTEAADAASPRRARRSVSEILALFRRRQEAPIGAVLCTHRPVLPTVLQALAAVAPNRVRARLPQANPYLRTGEVLVAHVLPRHRRGLRIVAVELHRARV
ncbi:NUDIX hydrolase [Serinibacter salmoneus]|uniref:8-oxo-dGTP diphosphatase n=1 Tax=Serinibacter salmoneus TaxID=556530 RepID=A0A2A9CZ53_9MICO|nr:NUDIX hydrolase [Serinibacter salmoneus]PFG18869.1 8-oxo-dGTP diphosphatase [Serinibacter salmoneus]